MLKIRAICDFCGALVPNGKKSEHFTAAHPEFKQHLEQRGNRTRIICDSCSSALSSFHELVQHHRSIHDIGRIPQYHLETAEKLSLAYLKEHPDSKGNVAELSKLSHDLGVTFYDVYGWMKSGQAPQLARPKTEVATSRAGPSQELLFERRMEIAEYYQRHGLKGTSKNFGLSEYSTYLALFLAGKDDCIAPSLLQVNRKAWEARRARLNSTMPLSGEPGSPESADIPVSYKEIIDKFPQSKLASLFFDGFITEMLNLRIANKSLKDVRERQTRALAKVQKERDEMKTARDARYAEACTQISQLKSRIKDLESELQMSHESQYKRDDIRQALEGPGAQITEVS